ncbi:alkaline phosphatase family protein [Salegentibacter flavus]|uniref:Phosphoglycerate mutase n=1 Tax=Salegentibacter flavus TaxID=287099 RepID=A0A1I5B6U5_9FLAO|nr:alkaline phosphatase family protein [Salegentibacter flavus]SFN70448.1 phosphoglycerate mutase [Salegentibacter flavus]
MKSIFKISIVVIAFFAIQQVKSQNSDKIIVITIDGLRWQELFGGADSLLINNKQFVNNPEELNELFWADSEKERRESLLPFLWNYAAKNGAILGNRWEKNKVNLKNKMVFSYPGYNEILTGHPDDQRINSNQKINNPNVTILEIANKSEDYKDKVLAFGSWDVFPYIINEERSGVPVNAGYSMSLAKKPSDKELYLNRIQEQTPRRWGSVRFDVFTHNYALEALKNQKPDLLYVAYGETDDFAHDGRYDQYLKSAKRTDQFLKEIWDFISVDPYYKDKTTMLLTTDHGRGQGIEDHNSWRSHGSSIPEADQTWFIGLGKQIRPINEQKENKQYYTTQFAPTIAKILNLKFESEDGPLPILKD